MADPAIRVRAGQTVTITATPASTSGAFTATAKDAAGRRIKASTEVSGSNVIITINADQWRDGKPGMGRVELKQVTGNVTSYPYTAQLRILPGIEAGRDHSDDYAW